ncbi:MAG: penicillin-binding protein 1C [bacterium]
MKFRSWQWHWRRLLVAGGGAVLVWCLLLWLAPPPDPYAVKPAGRQIFARDGSLLRGFLSRDEKWRLRVPLDDVSPHLIQAVLCHEDRWFHAHPGVNPVSVIRAAWTNLRSGRVVSGASTITMQLARLVEPRSRSAGYKLYQTFRALQYECRYTKDEILEMYLNLAPYGGNIEGVAAAAYIYFDKPPAELSLAEACLLGILPQAPSDRHPVRHPEAALTARRGLLERMTRHGLIDAATAQRADLEPLPASLRAIPFAAPHFCEWMTRQQPRTVNLFTTLDADLQSRAEGLVAFHLRRLRPHGIEQGAVVILQSDRAELLAMVGSADYADSATSGQVNGAVARRSPGSTLKPFVYGLAFDRGLATPTTLLEDVPIHFGSYSPQNYDGTFSGALTAGEALRRSRNVPAVLLASQLHAGGSFCHWLQEAGVTSLRRSADHYGLSLVLGGGDLTLLELAELYGILARQGIRRPLRTVQAPGATPTAAELRQHDRRVLSRGAAYLTLQELIGVQRPELDKVWQSGTHQVPVPWKTGTSYGHRDAWSIGIAGEYVVAVWIGNFDGTGKPPLVGSQVAAPLLFDCIDLLPRDKPGSWFHRPTGLGRRDICALSGAPAAPHCPAVCQADYLPGVSPASPCELHREIEIDDESGLAVCSRCRHPEQVSRQTVVWWPPRLATYMAANDLASQPIPPHNPDCPVFGRGEAPTILSPQDGMEYYVRSGVPLQDQQIALLASVNRACHRVYWFVDGVLFWRGEPGEPVFLKPTAGEHRVVVKDEAGRSATTSFRVVGDPDHPGHPDI